MSENMIYLLIGFGVFWSLIGVFTLVLWKMPKKLNIPEDLNVKQVPKTPEIVKVYEGR